MSANIFLILAPFILFFFYFYRWRGGFYYSTTVLQFFIYSSYFIFYSLLQSFCDTSFILSLFCLITLSLIPHCVNLFSPVPVDSSTVDSTLNLLLFHRNMFSRFPLQFEPYEFFVFLVKPIENHFLPLSTYSIPTPRPVPLQYVSIFWVKETASLSIRSSLPSVYLFTNVM